MSERFNLARDGWIPVIDVDTCERTEVGFLSLFGDRDYMLDVTSGRLFASLNRTLASFGFAAGIQAQTQSEYADRVDKGLSPVDRARVHEWIMSNQEKMYLFGDGALYQDSSMPLDSAAHWSVIDKTTVSTSGTMFYDDRLCDPSSSVPPKEAAKILLVAIHFPVGGRLPCKSDVYGTGSNSGSQPAPLSRVLVYPFMRSVPDSVGLLTAPGVPSGTVNLAWNQPGITRTSSTVRVSSGAADTYSWLPRRIRLVPDAAGNLSRAVIADGEASKMHTDERQFEWLLEGVLTDKKSASGAGNSWAYLYPTNDGGARHLAQMQRLIMFESHAERWYSQARKRDDSLVVTVAGNTFSNEISKKAGQEFITPVPIGARVDAGQWALLEKIVAAGASAVKLAGLLLGKRAALGSLPPDKQDSSGELETYHAHMNAMLWTRLSSDADNVPSAIGIVDEGVRLALQTYPDDLVKIAKRNLDKSVAKVVSSKIGGRR